MRNLGRGGAPLSAGEFGGSESARRPETRGTKTVPSFPELACRQLAGRWLLEDVFLPRRRMTGGCELRGRGEAVL